MRGPRPVPCIFPEEFLQDAMDTVRRRTASVQDVQRFRLVLLLHDQPSISHENAAEIVRLSARQVQRWRRRWAAGDFSIGDYPGRGKKPAFSPSRSRAGHKRSARGFLVPGSAVNFRVGTLSTKQRVSSRWSNAGPLKNASAKFNCSLSKCK